MAWDFETKRRARNALLPVLCFSAAVYFAYHALAGERGIGAYSRLTADIKATQALLADARAEREILEKKVSLLRAEALDPDMLEEQSHRTLNYLRANERIIFMQP